MMRRATPDTALRLAWSLAALATLGLDVSSRAQQQAPPPQVFRAEANLVYVDAYPRRGEQFVEGLTQNDFQVFEDGKPQTVQTFELITASNPLDAERRDPTSVADSERQAADPRNRLFVIYLDRFHTTRAGSRDSRQALVDFLNRTIGATDLFAVTTPEMPTGGLTFARRTGTIEQELAKHWDWGERDQMLTPVSPTEEHIVTCAMQAYAGEPGPVDAIHRRYRENLFYNSLDALILRLRDIREERTNLILVSEGWRPERERPELAKFPDFGAAPPIPTVGVGRGGRIVRGDPQSGNPDRAGCRAEVANLALVSFIDRFRDLVISAERANVTFYPIDVGGLHGNLGTVETLRTLATATDGYAGVNSNDIAAGFRRVADRLTSFYLLGYYSSNTVNDGKFRKIEVRVTQPGVSVAARRGYMSPPPDAVVAAARAEAAARAGPAVPDDVAGALERLARLGSDQDVFATAAVRPGALEIVVDLAERDVDRGRWAKGASVEATVTGSAGASLSGQAAIEPGRRAVSVRVPLAADQKGPWRVRVRITDAAGTVEAQTDADAPPPGALGPPTLLRGAGPARAPMQPVAQPSFRRNERLRVQWPIARDATAPVAQILDRRGQPLGTSLPVAYAENGGERVATVDLALGSLAPGDYVLQLTEGSERQLVAFRLRQ
jgi:VWFA-related protein